jgi:hypothetical protein
MPKAIPVPHRKKADIYVLAAIVAILWMMLLQGFLDVSFPTGAVDSDAPTPAPQRAITSENSPDVI